MPIPEKYHLDQLLKLNGDAQVTYPYNTTHRRVERAFGVPRGTPAEQWGVRQDDEFTGTVLVDQQVVGGDQQDVNIYQAYEDLPGPWLPGTRYDDDLGPVQTRRRAILTSTASAATESATGKTTYEARGDSALVSWQIEESWSDGSGSAGNPAYPINHRDYWDDERGSVHETTQIVPYAAHNGTLTVATVGSDRVATETSYEAVPNAALQKKVVKTFIVPGPTIADTRMGEDGVTVSITRQLMESANVVTGETLTGGVWTKKSKSPKNSVLAVQVIESRTVPGVAVVVSSEVVEGNPITTTRQLIAAAGSSQSEVVTTGVHTKISLRPVESSILVVWKIIQTQPVPGPALIRYDVDAETNAPVRIVTQLVAKPVDLTGFPSGYGQFGGASAEYRPISDVIGTKVIVQFDPEHAESPVTYTTNEVKLANYSYPSLIFSASGNMVQANDGTTRIQIAWTRRAAFSRNVPHIVSTTWGPKSMLEALAPTEVFDPKFNNLIYDGAFIHVNERNVLNDHIGPLEFTTGTSNPKWPEIVETVEFAASTLSATGYVALIGTYQIISYTLEEWKYGLWRLRIISVPIR